MDVGRRVIRFAVLGAALASSPGCADPAGALDPDVVHDLSRKPGDAVGLSRTGFYDALLTPVSCGCPMLATLEGISLCQRRGLGDGPNGTNPVPLTLAIVQTDGILLVRYADVALTGGLNTDGTFAIGALLDMTTLVTSGEVVTRMDGAFDEADNADTFEATLQNHLDGSAAPGLDTFEVQTSVQCLEVFDVTAERRSAPQ